MRNKAVGISKKILPILLSVIMIVSSAPFCFATAYGGSCGDGLTWALDNFVLTVSGTGRMDDYRPKSQPNLPLELPPWIMYSRNIARIVIEEGCEYIGSYAFYDCPMLCEVKFPEKSLKRIGSWSFAKAAFKKLAIPDCVKTIDNGAFSDCEQLCDVEVGKNVAALPDHLFRGDKSLAKVSLPSGCTRIGISAFENCASLKEFDMTYIERIESCAFSNCGFSEVKFGKDLKYMQTNVFYGCKNLSSAVFADGTSPNEVSNLFLNNTPYYSALPSGLYTMFDGKVLMCKGSFTAKSLTVPEGVEIISDFCFDGSKYLASVSFPSTLKTICSYAFRDCPKLKSMFIPPSVGTLCTNSVGIYTNSYGYYVEVEGFKISGKGFGAAHDYALLHGFEYTCLHECSDVFVSDDCSAGGIKFEICAFCGACTGQSEFYPESHTFGDVFCDGGYRVRKCVVCGYEERTEIHPGGHTPAPVWNIVSLPDCVSDGSAVLYCEECGEAIETITLEKRGHKPADKYEVLSAPSCAACGAEALYCTSCGEIILEREIPKTEHVPSGEWIELTLPSEDGTLYGCSVLKCKNCSCILEIRWLSAQGREVSGALAQRTNAAAIKSGICERFSTENICRMDYCNDGVLNLHDLAALKKLSLNEDKR